LKQTSIKQVKSLIRTLPKPTVSESEITESFLHGSGPGGQKINKTSSAVQLKHIPTGTVIKCQATRSRTQNRKIARQLLADKLDILEKGEESRVVIKAELKKRRKDSRAKKAKRKYRALAEKDDREGFPEGQDEADEKDQ
jgi:protein subunit release factor B